MQRLRGSDAFMVYADSRRSPFVTLKVGIYRPTNEQDVPDINDVEKFVAKSIAKQAIPACMRILRVPFDLHHPVWVPDPDFSPDNHVHRTKLAPPGDKAQLCDFISELMSRPLDPDRPLWEVWLIEGLENDRLAIAAKLHHSLADGNLMVSMIAENHSKPINDEASTRGFITESLPGSGRLIRDAFVDLVKSYTVELPHYYRYLKRARESSRTAAEVKEDICAPFSAPYTVLNSAGGSERIYRYETTSLPDFKNLSKKLGCTINTLVMGVCSEALRRYLQEVDAVPPVPLIASMPLGIDTEDDFKTQLNRDIHNNNVAQAIVALDLNIRDFAQRLEAINRSAVAAIQHVRASGGKRIDNYLDYLPGTIIRGINSTMVKRQRKRQNAFANLIISNVKGPRQTLYAVDGRLELEELLSSGNLHDALNLNITVWSYVNHLSFSCYTRKGALPEPEKINDHIREVLEELYAGS